MGARSRKRGRSGGRAAAAGEPPASPPPGEAEPADGGDAMRRGYARGRARDEQVRAELEPLAPGERPRVVTLAAVVAFFFAIANVVAALSGNDLSSTTGDPSVITAVTTALLVLAGAGMLARQYWAVLGFQAILGIQIIFFSLYLLGVRRWWDAVVPLVAIGLMGWLFWKLVRAMARMQMPERGPTEPTR
ncbi:MAG TPA: hypothetical protein VM299_04190 [Solirubrobacteraceae bacterium]|jgi:hypothetical protein|nr:hypothetical protein [Solirubrobacteraceae bacterium]